MPDFEFENELLDANTEESDNKQRELTPDEEYELWCHYEEMQREQLFAAWGVESWEELEFLGHDW